jgi:hypothetical protein
MDLFNARTWARTSSSPVIPDPVVLVKALAPGFSPPARAGLAPVGRLLRPLRRHVKVGVLVVEARSIAVGVEGDVELVDGLQLGLGHRPVFRPGPSRSRWSRTAAVTPFRIGLILAGLASLVLTVGFRHRRLPERVHRCRPWDTARQVDRLIPALLWSLGVGRSRPSRSWTPLTSSAGPLPERKRAHAV